MHMREVFTQMDVDGSGEISGDEMEFFLTEPGLRSYVDALGINAENTRMLFRLIDVDNSGRINLHEFCEGCLRLQGEAKSIDVHSMIYQMKYFLAKWADFTEYVEDKLSILNVLERDSKERRSIDALGTHSSALGTRSSLQGGLLH